jgi:hypothetical protein
MNIQTNKIFGHYETPIKRRRSEIHIERSAATCISTSPSLAEIASGIKLHEIKETIVLCDICRHIFTERHRQNVEGVRFEEECHESLFVTVLSLMEELLRCRVRCASLDAGAATSASSSIMICFGRKFQQ